jgi:tRNA A37 threonylcarbamoyladenosine dehydratase/ribonuclease HI
MEQFIRTELLIGKEAVKKLNNSRVAVFGIGGVGGHCAEALVRSGVGTIDIVDNDVIAESNINRQIVALHSTIGRYKTEVMKERLLDINPNVKVNEYRCFFLPENASQFPFDEYDYVVDAVDTVTAKIAIIMAAQEHGVSVISSMGAGNKLHPEMFEIADIYKTSVCPLAKVMRQELKKRGVKKLKCVYSKEEPLQPTEESFGGELPAPDASRRSVPGSSAFTPSVAGLIIAGEVIRSLSEVSASTVQPEIGKQLNIEDFGNEVKAAETEVAAKVAEKDKATPKVEKITAYVDGSYNVATKEYSYGAVIFAGDKKECFSEKFNDPELATMRNVAGELEGSMKAMRYAVEAGAKELDIFYDYEGIEKWCTGAWKTNKDGTKAYKAFYEQISQKVKVNFHKVRGHSGDRYNDEADALAKAALGI